ncbi:hypothetical protein [Vagococcus salmoninarum]|uniref:hypothetical protein n=1 Tax=Vagococcus salmoninarum TaxID=2739 RepID=UPI00187FAEFE|nr:hypothetical protein [Vagococcus salmoninarum]MBE9387856.1 hypothetical protein [Vagococcus salmoninarum]
MNKKERLMNLAAEVRVEIEKSYPEIYKENEAELMAFPEWCFKVARDILDEEDLT